MAKLVKCPQCGEDYEYFVTHRSYSRIRVCEFCKSRNARKKKKNETK